MIVALVAVAMTAPAHGSEHIAAPRLVFPLVAKTELRDNYGDARGGRHAAIDMESHWRTPVVRANTTCDATLGSRGELVLGCVAPMP